MASGSIGATSNNQYIVGRLDWNSTPNTAGNYSTVNAYLYMWRNNSGYTTTGSGTWTITINGSSYSTTATKTLTYNNTSYLIYQVTGFNVPHNADGTKAITISATGGMPSTSYTATYCSGTATLDTIPRASQPTITVNPIPLDGSTSTTIQGHRASASFTHNYYYAFGGIGKTLIASGQNDYVWTPPQSLMNQIPTATSGTGTIYCDTYNGATYIGSTTVGFTVTVPSNIVPTFSSVVPSELNSTVASIMGGGVYVKSLSNVRFTINGASGTYGSTIVGGTITFNGSPHGVGISSGSGYYDTGTLGMSGTPSYTAYVTDSRGRTSSVSGSVNITIRDYYPPSISNFTVQRCLSTGVVNDLGTYVKVTRVGTASSLINGNEKNAIACEVYYKDRLSGTWILCTSGTNPPSNPIGINVATTGAVGSAVNGTYTYGNATPLFPITSAYDWKFVLADYFNTTTTTTQVPTGVTVMSWGRTGVGIGKVWTKGSLDVGGVVYTNNDRLVLRDNSLEEHSTNALAELGVNYYGYNGGATQYRNLSIYDGKGGFITQFDAPTKKVKVFGSISSENADLSTASQLVGDYVARTTGNKMIWTIGANWNTWATQYGIAYEYGNLAGWGNDHQFTFRGAGATHIRFGYESGNMATDGKMWAIGGYKRLGFASEYSWTGTIPYQGSVVIYHDLGYAPMYSANGTTGNVNLNFGTTNGYNVTVSNWSASGGNAWTGTIYFW